jgi:hypothetical protein
MLVAVLIILIILWFLGYIHIGNLNLPDITLFTLNGQDITLIKLLIFAVIVWAIGILPSPLRQIGFVILVIWLLSLFGILAFFAGLQSILVLAVIVGLVLALLGVF